MYMLVTVSSQILNVGPKINHGPMGIVKNIFEITELHNPNKGYMY